MTVTADTSPIRTLAIVGDGLAAWLAAVHLSVHLPDTVEITVVGGDTSAPMDALYGAVLPPEFYDVHTAIGVTEPELILETGTAFALGTAIENWGTAARSWVQSFHLPLPVTEGVPFHTLVAQRPDDSLQPYLVSAAAARAGRFVHPPQDPANPMSRAEYGYLIDPAEIAERYRRAARNVLTVPGKVATVERDGDTVGSITTDGGDVVTADLFIDASGPHSALLDAPTPTRTIDFRATTSPTTSATHPLARIRAGENGFTVLTATRRTQTQLDIAAGTDGEHTVPVFQREAAWVGNVVSLGQTACTVEPLTVAPMRLLLRDVLRIAELFPISTDMAVERRTYNAEARDDQDHALMFHHAHFADVDLPDAPYFRDAACERSAKLDRKLAQYAARAYLVAYDNEPFYPVDWAVLHDGLGRRPARADRLAQQADPARVEARLSAMRAAVSAVVPKMPPHPVYLAKLGDYLARKHKAGASHVA